MNKYEVRHSIRSGNSFSGHGHTTISANSPSQANSIARSMGLTATATSFKR